MEVPAAKSTFQVLHTSQRGIIKEKGDVQAGTGLFAELLEGSTARLTTGQDGEVVRWLNSKVQSMRLWN